MLLTLDPASPVPLFEQLATQVRVAVVAGRLTPGDRLPSARDLAADLEVNQHTVLRAYQTLRDEGLLELRQGRGATVARQASGSYDGLRQALDAVRSEAAAVGVPLSVVASLVAAPIGFTAPASGPAPTAAS